MRIAIAGGGLFGCTAALLAAKAGHKVDIYEAGADIMEGATAHGFARLHRGYHYPRSPETGLESRRGASRFRHFYSDAVISRGTQIYRVAPDSKVPFADFVAFCGSAGMPFEAGDNSIFAQEDRINIQALQALIRHRVRHEPNIAVFLQTAARRELRQSHDKIILAAYAGLNDCLDALGLATQVYKFQVVERPVVLLSDKLRDVSVVVVDGPYGCIDPLDNTPLHILGHVTETIVAENVGVWPIVPRNVAPLINAGLVRKPKNSRFETARASLSTYIPALNSAHHIGSSYTVRCVLAGEEATDRRPTIVRPADDQVVQVLSGKLGTAVDAAYEALRLCERDSSQFRFNIAEGPECSPSQATAQQL